MRSRTLVPRSVFGFNILVAVVALAGAQSQVPVITGFSSLSAKPGATITLQGSNFSSSAVENRVLFGTVRGTVQSSTATEIVVQVPLGASFAPITVQVPNGKSGTSVQSFLPVASSVGTIASKSFGTTRAVSFTTNSSGLPFSEIFDFDNDGKPDVLVPEFGGLSIYRNLGTPNIGTGAFGPRIFQAGTFSDVAIADFNSDGLADIAAVSNSGAHLFLLTNTSSPAAISFTTSVFSIPPPPYSGIMPRIQARDIDGDGYVDLALVRDGILIFRNKGLSGPLEAQSFEDPLGLTSPVGGSSNYNPGLELADLDCDGKVDLLSNVRGKFFVRRNIAEPGALTEASFEAALELSHSGPVYAFATADLNSDGKLEIVAVDNNKLKILPNNNLPGAITEASFGTAVVIHDSAVAFSGRQIAFADVDGDGQPEIFLSGANSSALWIFPHQVSSHLAEAYGPYAVPPLPLNASTLKSVAIGDVNLDGKPDVCATGTEKSLVTQNLATPLMATALSVSPKSVTVTYPWRSLTTISANLIMSDASSLNVTRSSNWEVSDPSSASFLSPGIVEANRTGIASILCDFQGRSASATLTTLPIQSGTTPGNPDMSFLPVISGGKAIHGMALQGDGRILIVGDFAEVNGTPRAKVARLNQDGTLDLTFDPGEGPDGQVNDICLSQGRILIAGTFTHVGGKYRPTVAALLPDGTLDSSIDFHFDPIEAQSAEIVRVRPDGKILVAGTSLQLAGESRRQILIQFLPSWSRDPSFDTPQFDYGFISSLVLRSDGSAVIAGGFSIVGDAYKRIAKITENGAVDPSFQDILNGSSPTVMALQADGKIVIAGSSAALKGVGRLNEDGSFDSSFVGPANRDFFGAGAIALQKNGKIVLTNYELTFRLNSDGTDDASFDASVSPDWTPQAFIIQPDEMILSAGGRYTYNGVPRLGIAKLRGDITTYPGWLAQNFSPQEIHDFEKTGPERNATGDSVENLYRYATGLGARAEFPGKNLDVEQAVEGALINFPRLKLATDLLFDIGVSRDLQYWDFSGKDIQQVGTPASTANLTIENVKFKYVPSDSDDSPVFFQLRVRLKGN